MRVKKSKVEKRRVKNEGCSFSLMRISSHRENPTSKIKGYKVKKGGLFFSSHGLVFCL